MVVPTWPCAKLLANRLPRGPAIRSSVEPDHHSLHRVLNSKSLGQTEKAPGQSGQELSRTRAIATVICAAEQAEYLFVPYELRVMLPVSESQPRMQRGSRKGFQV